MANDGFSIWKAAYSEFVAWISPVQRINFEDLDSCPSMITQRRRDRAHVPFVCDVDTIVFEIIRPSIVYECLSRLSRHWQTMLKPAQIEVSFINAARCFDTRRTTL